MINTLYIILEQTAMYLPLVLGSYLSMSLLKLPDLSIESAYVFGAILGAETIVLFKHAPIGLVLVLTCLASMIGGMLVGVTSSFISQFGRIPHLLAAIITFGIFHGINQLVLQSAYFSLSGNQNPLELLPYVAQHPELMMLAALVIALCCIMILLFRTQLSYAFAIVGNNPQFFSHYGVSSTYVTIVGIMMGNALAGFSGYLFAQSNGFVEITIGYGKALLCITALILGKAFFRTTKPITMLVPLVGTLAYFCLQQLLLKIGFNLKYFTAIQAVVVLVFIIIMYRSQGRTLRGDQLGV